MKPPAAPAATPIAAPRPAFPAMAPIAVPPSPPIAAPLSTRCWVGVWPAHADKAIAAANIVAMAFIERPSTAGGRGQARVALAQIAKDGIDGVVGRSCGIAFCPFDESGNRFRARGRGLGDADIARLRHGGGQSLVVL